MADFSTAQKLVASAEAGYQADPRDKGNYTGGQIGVGDLIGTNWGVSAPTLKEYLGRTPSVDDMKNLSYATALQIFKSRYWDYMKLDTVKNQSIANLVYDGAINQGAGSVKKTVTASLNNIGINASASDTTATLAEKVNQAPQDQLFDEIKKNRLAKYDPGSYAYTSWKDRLDKITFFFGKGIKLAGEHWVITALVGLAIVTTTIILVKHRKKLIKSANAIHP